MKNRKEAEYVAKMVIVMAIRDLMLVLMLVILPVTGLIITMTSETWMMFVGIAMLLSTMWYFDWLFGKSEVEKRLSKYYKILVKGVESLE